MKNLIVVKFGSWLEVALATMLIASTENYSIGINPSQSFLQPVLSESGSLVNNWQSEIRPQNFWFLTEVFARIPINLLTKFVLASWFIQIAIIVVCFMLILRKNLVNLNLRIAGYILIAATSIPGIGATSGIIGVFYPSNLAFSMVCVLIAAIIFQKNILLDRKKFTSFLR